MAADLNCVSTAYNIDYKNNSHSAEFEFKISSDSSETETVFSSAEELFFRGIILPLHLPLRLQMFEKLHSNSLSERAPNNFCTYPDESFVISREFDAEGYLSCDSSDDTKLINAQLRKHPCKTFKLLKQSLIICSKVKASRAYVKSLFGKTSCRSTVDCVEMDDCSFSSKRGKLIESSELKFKEQCRIFDSEYESSIESAIAHCKRSSQKSVSEIGFRSLSGSRVVFEDLER